MNSTEIKAELEVLRESVKPKLQRISTLEQALRTTRSSEAVNALGLRRSDVTYSRTLDAPWHGDIYKFAQWATDHDPKPWMEWNGWLYLRAEVLDGRMDRDPKMLWDSVPAA